MQAVQEIIEEYTAKNLVLTLRQVHYQLVSRNIIINNKSAYKSLQTLLKDARMSGRIDWSAIVDRNRDSYIPYFEENIPSAIERTLLSYRLDRMRNQDVHIECLIEKMAIYDIVVEVTRRYSIPLTGDKGNCSATILYDISKRMLAAQAAGKHCIVLYIGDHDPSGLKMIESTGNTLSLMGVQDLEFRPVALTKEQAIKYNLPPQDVKDTDTNTPEYTEKYGKYSWECDALLPNVLQDMLEEEILISIDLTKLREVLQQEQDDRARLTEIVYSWKDSQTI